MKKLIFTVTNDLNYDQRMIRICSSLSKAGYEVLLVGRMRGDSKVLASQTFKQKRLSCFFEKGKLFYLEYNLRLFVFLLLSKFDLVCGIDLDTLLPAVVVSTLKGKRCVYDAHEYFTEVPEVVNRPLTKKVWTLVGQFAIPRVHGAYTVCQSLAQIMGERYGIDFEVIRNVPFPIDELRVVKTNPEKVLLYQGALNDGRGLPELIAAMQEIRGAVLWLAGEGDLSEELRQQVKDLQLDSKVKFLGFVRPDKLKEYTQQADIGLNLLENKGLSYYYSLANKAFDYIQSEKPAIHMAFPEYQLLNEAYEVALLLPDLQTATLTKAINQLANDQPLYDRLKENTKAAKLVFNWTIEEQKLLHFYHEIFIP